MPNWNGIQDEIRQSNLLHSNLAQAAPNTIRKKYLEELHAHTGRNVIAYYSGFLSKPEIMQSGISDEDKNGFMSVIHGMDRRLGLDLMIHTP